MAFDDRPPAAGALDRHVVDDDVPVHLERPGGDEHRLVHEPRAAQRSRGRTRRRSRGCRVGSAPKSVTETELRGCGAGRSDVLEVGEVDHCPRGVRVGRHRQADDVARPGRSCRGARAARRRSASAGTASCTIGRGVVAVGTQRALGDPPVGVEHARVRVVRERIEVVEVRVLRRQRDRLRMRVAVAVAVVVDADRQRRIDAAAGRGIGNRVADRHGVRRLA